MFPSIGDLHVSPFTDEALYMEQFQKANFWYQQSFHGVDLSALRDDAVAEYFRQPVVDTFDLGYNICHWRRFLEGSRILKLQTSVQNLSI